MAPFYGCGSTVSRLEPLRGGSLLFTTKNVNQLVNIEGSLLLVYMFIKRQFSILTLSEILIILE